MILSIIYHLTNQLLEIKISDQNHFNPISDYLSIIFYQTEIDGV
jgi:hypothetical protein